MELLILLLLILLNGLFSMAEIALVSARKIRLENAAKKGNRQAKEALKLSNNPGKFLSTVQIGITLIGILTGIYSGEKITGDLKNYLLRFEVLQPYADTLAVVLVLLVLTFFSLVLGELVPKKIGLANPEGISKAVARPMKIVSMIAAPFVWALTFSTDIIIKLFGIKPSKDNAVTEEEIKAIVQEGTSSGEVQYIEKDIVSRVFSLGDRKISSLMTPRTQLVMIHRSESKDEIIHKIREKSHSIYPIYDDEKQDIVGVLKLKEVFFEITQPEFHLDKYIREPHYMPEFTTAYDALKEFKEKKMGYVIVTDEFGQSEGILTLNDILEALAGNADEFNFEEAGIQLRSDGTWLADGQYPFADFLHYFEMEDLLHEYEYNTLGGLILDELKNIPKTGDKIIWNSYQLEVVDMDGTRIDKVLIQKTD